MRRSRLPLSRLYPLVQAYRKDSPLARPRPRGRPQAYPDALILALWLYQTLWRTSYRETLETAQGEGFPTPALGTYHYRVRRLPLSLFQVLLQRVGQVLRQKDPNSWQMLLVDGTGFGFQDRYALSWRRGEMLRQVRAHVRLVLLALVDARGRGIWLGAAVGPPYASEISLLREVLASLDALPPCPVVGDRGYDAVDVLERLQQLGAVPAFRMKDTWRYAVRHPLRRASQQGWRRWGKRRYRVEGFFGTMKLKMGAVFPLVREDLALRRALAAAVAGVQRLGAAFQPGSPGGFFVSLLPSLEDLPLAGLSPDFSNSPSPLGGCSRNGLAHLRKVCALNMHESRDKGQRDALEIATRFGHSHIAGEILLMHTFERRLLFRKCAFCSPVRVVALHTFRK